MNPLKLHLVNSTGLDDFENDKSLFVYPNPVTDQLQIRSEGLIYSVTLTGLSGNCIKILSNVSANLLQIDTGDLVSGMYMLKIETSNGTTVRKLIKSISR
jgi:hypothetical protein